ncbi:MAG: hydroxyacid dehydrogenase [Desulfobacterales bacterium]
MKIVIFEAEQWEHDAFDPLASDHELTVLKEPLSADNAKAFEQAEIISTFIYSDLSAGVLKQFRQLKMIATRSTGFDHIDLEYCDKNGITICNVPTYGDHTVAEHVFGLLLAISHKLIPAIDRTRRGDFSLEGLRGFDLEGKTLGVIGTGNIGRHVIRIAKGFNMKVMAFDVSPDRELASTLEFEYGDMDTVLAESDIITLHVPSNEKTHHLISEKEFSKMKDGVVIINTARGEVLDVHALAGAIADGKVAAAGLDVLPEEPTIREEVELLRSVFRKQKKHNIETLLTDHILLRLRNVYITPHNAFNTREAVQRILDVTVENITAYVSGKPQNVAGKKSRLL